VKIKNLAFVGIPVTDLERARAFYEGVLGLEIAETMGQGTWIEYSLGNNTLAIASVGDKWLPSSDGSSPALEVDDFDATIKWLKDRHITFTNEPFETPCCRIAIIQDPDGNKIAIHKLKPEEERQPCP
jgi:predicted enzyme related to lactoylglutathione lyase